MKYRKHVPTVPTIDTEKDDSGNTQNTPINSGNVPTVPTVPTKNIDTYIEGRVLCGDGDIALHTHTHTLWGGVHVFQSGNWEQNDDLQVVEAVLGVGTKKAMSGNKVGTLSGNTAQRPPLPANLWVTGLATFADARQVQKSLSGRYVTHCGLGDTGYYVAGPGSGLCAVHVPYPGDAGAHDLQFADEVTV